MKKRIKYPVGIQTFSEIIEEGYRYVDKTAYVYEMANYSKYVFLSRPRRFGKSLLVSTLESYFEGRKELFKGLAIENLETKWTQYPVFHFDMSKAKCDSIEVARNRISFMLSKYEAKYGITPNDPDLTIRLENLIETAYNETGQKVVLLFDEYDSPILNVMDDENKTKEFRTLLRSFYSPIKACDAIIRFGFITGITKFSQLSIFSEINNLDLISMDDKYAGICGITETELVTAMDEDIEMMGEKLEMSKDETIAALKRQYDGYHFSEAMEDVYNPFSLINALNKQKLDNYWFSSATPSWLIGRLRKADFNIEELENSNVALDSFNAPTENNSSVFPLLFQSGYMTIKGYNPISENYTLGIPNNEVRMGLFRDLLKYLEPKAVEADKAFIGEFAELVLKDKIHDALRRMRCFIAGIPYDTIPTNEKGYQMVFFLISRILCEFVDCEVKNLRGRTDMVLMTKTHIYVFEFKFRGNLDKAMQQIAERGYSIKYECDGRKVVKIAANFNDEIRTLDGWSIDNGDGKAFEWNAEGKVVDEDEIYDVKEGLI